MTSAPGSYLPMLLHQPRHQGLALTDCPQFLLSSVLRVRRQNDAERQSGASCSHAARLPAAKSRYKPPKAYRVLYRQNHNATFMVLTSHFYFI